MRAAGRDVEVEGAHVVVNGEDLGIVDRYDGWPGYLWLPEGTYDVAFYLPGYKTIARQIADQRWRRGRRSAPRISPPRPTNGGTRGSGSSRSARSSSIARTATRATTIRTGTIASATTAARCGTTRVRWDHGPGMSRGMSREDSGQSHLRLSVEPRDASVYLDGQFVGTGTDLSLLHAGLPISPGSHKLSVVRPGHKPVEKSFDVKSGGDVELEISLESGS